MLLEYGGHAAVPHECVAVEAHLGGGEGGVVHEEGEAVLGADELLLQLVDGVRLHLDDVVLELHQLLRIRRRRQRLLRDLLVLIAQPTT